MRTLHFIAAATRNRAGRAAAAAALLLALTVTVMAQAVSKADLKAAVVGVKTAARELKAAERDDGRARRDVEKAQEKAAAIARDLKELQADFDAAPTKEQGDDLIATLNRLGNDIKETKTRLAAANQTLAVAQSEMAKTETRVATANSQLAAAENAADLVKEKLQAAELAEARAREAEEKAEEARKLAEQQAQDQAKREAAARREAERKAEEARELAEKQAEEAAARAAAEAREREKAERERLAELERQQQEAAELAEKQAREQAEREAEAKRLAAKREAEALKLAEKREREAAKAKADAERAALKALDDAQNDADDARKDVAKAQQDVQDLQEDMAELQRRAQEALAAVNHCAAEVAAAQDDRAKKGAERDLERARRDAAKVNEKIQDLAAELTEAEAELAAERRDAAAAAQALQDARNAAAPIIAERERIKQAELAAKRAAEEQERQERLAAEKARQAEEARQIAEAKAKEAAARAAAEAREREKAERERLAELERQQQEAAELAEKQAREQAEREAEARRLAEKKAQEARQLAEKQAREQAEREAEARREAEKKAAAARQLAEEQAREKARREEALQRRVAQLAEPARREVEHAQTALERAQTEAAEAAAALAAAQADQEKAAALVPQRRSDLQAAQDENTRKKAIKALEKAQANADDMRQDYEQAAARATTAKQTLADQQKRVADATRALERAETEAASTARAEAAEAERRRQAAAAAEAARQAECERLAAARAAERAEPKPVLQPQKHVREPLVSEPAPWAPKQDVFVPAALAGEQDITAPPAQTADIAKPGRNLQFDLPMVSGDKEIVEKLEAWQEWADYVTFNAVTPEEINEFHGKLTKALQEEGFVFAKVTFPTRIWAYGIFLAKVDCGPLGTIVVKGNRYYSAKQVIRALARQDGERFNYARIHGDIFDLNTKPDIMVDTKLKPIMQDGRRVINAELTVRDDLPLHGALEIENDGADTSNDWRFRTTLQHVNLSKRDDILSIDWITSPQLDDVNAWSGGYYLPLGDSYSLSLYGGYSTSDIEDVLPQLDIHGEGYFFGAQITKTLKDTPRYRLQLSGGWIFQNSVTEHAVQGMTLQERKLDLSMPSITLGYASRTFDRLGGRNFMSNTITGNFAGSLGSSSKADFNAQGIADADGEFIIDRFQLARLQHFFRGEEGPGKWSLFMKLEGQLASDTLISGLRKQFGGSTTGRGYRPGEIAGDQGLTAVLELRTPLFHNFIPGLKKNEEYLQANPEAWQRHRLQFVAFADAGVMDVKQPRAGEQSDEQLLSAGLGFRLGLTKYSQMRLDYGYPIIQATEDYAPHGLAHLSMQLQF